MTAGDLNHWGGLALLAMVWVAVLIGASIPIVLLARISYRRFVINRITDAEINRLMDQELGR